MAHPAHEYTRAEQLARSNALRLIRDHYRSAREMWTGKAVAFLDVLEDTLYSPQELAKAFKSLEDSGDILRARDGHSRELVGWFPLFWN